MINRPTAKTERIAFAPVTNRSSHVMRGPHGPSCSGFTIGQIGEIISACPPLTRQKKITFGELRASGVRGLLIYCSDYKCSHWTTMSADRWPDDGRLSDLEPLFTCQAFGQRGADVRPNFHWEEEARRATITGLFPAMAGQR